MLAAKLLFILCVCISHCIWRYMGISIALKEIALMPGKQRKKIHEYDFHAFHVPSDLWIFSWIKRMCVTVLRVFSFFLWCVTYSHAKNWNKNKLISDSLVLDLNHHHRHTKYTRLTPLRFFLNIFFSSCYRNVIWYLTMKTLF